MTIHLAGVPVKDNYVLELARLVDDETLAAKLEMAYGRGCRLTPESAEPPHLQGFRGMGATGLEPVTPSLSSWCSPN